MSHSLQVIHLMFTKQKHFSPIFAVYAFVLWNRVGRRSAENYEKLPLLINDEKCCYLVGEALHLFFTDSRPPES